MKQSNIPPVYSQVAFDIASKIASGELREGERFTGRSLMGSQYGVSSETIRRAMSLLGDLGIVSVQHNVGSTVLSHKRAEEYVQQYQASKDLRTMKARLRELLAQRDAVNAEIEQLFWQIGDLWDRFRASDRFRTYEFELGKSNPVIGKSIGQLEFRQRTGATVVAVQRGGDILLSPEPDTTFQCGDILVVACEYSKLEFVTELLG